MLALAEAFLLPLRGVIAVIDQIHGYLWNELNDEESLQRQLMELRLQYELDEVGEAEYEAREAQLLERLREVRRRRLEAEADG